MEAPTIYTADAQTPPASEADLPARTDVAIVGGGLTGLSAAYHLNHLGFQVTLLEAGEIANGASGRNGGQLHPGQRRDHRWLTKTLGASLADGLWRLGDEALALTHTLRETLGAPADFRPGLITAAHTSAALDDALADAEHLAARFNTPFERLDRAALAARIGTQRYVGGLCDPTGGHMNPAAFAAALAQEAHVAGAHLIRNARVSGFARTPRGFALSARGQTVMAQTVVFAGNGMMRGLVPWLDARIVPLRNYILATQPLRPALIPRGEAVADTRFVIRYFRQDLKRRMVFGGGESFGAGPRDIAGFVRRYLAEVYPDLRGAKVAAAWGGTLGITRDRMPLIRRLEPGVYVAAGFSGQGLALSTFAGKIIADAVGGEASRVDVFARLPAPKFPGGRPFAKTLAQLGIATFAIRDRLGA
ncbi:MAG: FAD-binding oxidoreductase [Pseudomonadota bacterium]